MGRQGAHNIGVTPGNGQTYTFPNQTGTVQLANLTNGVGSGPSSSPTQTQTITHNLGRAPSVIRIFAVGRFNGNGSASVYSSSWGSYTASGNACAQLTPITVSTASTNPISTTSYAVIGGDGSGNVATGVIQNVTSTQFDIAWTFTAGAGDLSTNVKYMWEAQ